jgi:hypothetical protein
MFLLSLIGGKPIVDEINSQTLSLCLSIRAFPPLTSADKIHSQKSPEFLLAKMFFAEIDSFVSFE